MTSQMGAGRTESDVCELICIMDRSGSMAASKYFTEGGFNGFIAAQKLVPGQCFVSLYQFDDQHDAVYEGRPISEVPPYVVTPRGWTALYDAMGRAITTALGRITDLKRKVVIMTCTDGAENMSKEYTAEKLRVVIDQAKARGWQLLFIGADQDAFVTAGHVGILRGQTISTVSNAAGAQALYSSASKNFADYRMGAKADTSWTADDRKKQEDAGAQKSP